MNRDFIFDDAQERLIYDENDLEGIVAYYLYKKREKNFFEEELIDKNDITLEEYKTFKKLHLQEKQLKDLRIVAKNILDKLKFPQPEKKQHAKGKRTKFNDTFDRLVRNENDFIGIIAYSLYKKEKNDFCKSVLERRGVVEEWELEDFYEKNNKPERLKKYREEAEKIFYSLMDGWVQRKEFTLIVELSKSLTKEIQSNRLANEDSFQKIINRLDSGFKYKQADFLMGIAENLVATIVWLFIVLLILVVLLPEETKEKLKAKATETVVGHPINSDSTKTSK